MQKIKNILKITKFIVFLKILRNVIFYTISLFIPKSRNIVIIGGWFGERFADNSKYTFLYLSKHAEELGFKKIIFVTRSKKLQNEISQQNLNVLKIWSLKSIWYHFRAYFHIVDQSYKDINSIFSVRSKRVHLWHGFPLKRIGEIEKYLKDGTFSEDIIPPKESQLLKTTKKLSSNGYWEDFYMLGTSELSKNIMSRAFNVPTKKMILSGYPRNFNFITNEPLNFYTNEEKELLDLINSYATSNKLLIGYFPTFRDRAKTNLFGVDNLNQIADFLDICEDYEIKVITKFHSAEKSPLNKIIHHDALTNIPPYFDIYNYLKLIDIVISDYSSIAFDFLLLDKPVIFFPYDLNYYSNKDRKLIFNYEEFSPGPLINSIDELKLLLPKLKNNFQVIYKKEYGEDAKKLKTKIYSNYEKFDIFHLVNEIKNI